MKLPWHVRLKMKLAYQWQRRHFWFAHYPDCRFFSHLLVRVHNWRICLGCLLFWSGFCATIIIMVGLRHWWQHALFAPILLTAIALIVALSIWDIYVQFDRWPHWIIRFLGGGSFTLFFTWVSLPPPSWFKLIALVCAFIGFRYASQLRRRHMEDPCQQCPYYVPASVCPGFSERVAMEKQYIAWANDYLDTHLQTHIQQLSRK